MYITIDRQWTSIVIPFIWESPSSSYPSCSPKVSTCLNAVQWLFITFLSTALMYCSLDTLIGKLRGGEEDEFNSVGAATLTGMIFKSTAGLRPIAIAGALGGGLATAYHFGEKLINSRGHSISTPNWAWILLNLLCCCGHIQSSGLHAQ